MQHEHYLREGDLNSSLEAIQALIRNEANEVKHRIFLFQLLCIMGQWHRAAKQLDVMAKMDVSALPVVHEYKAAIACEIFREAVFSGSETPVFVGEPEEWQALILQALKLTSAGNHQEASVLQSKALALAPTSSGTINGDAFEWIADADSRLGPILEVIVDGEYRWVSFTHIKRIAIEAPEDLRDFVWVPAHIQWQTDGESFVLVPTRYPFSAGQDDQLALAKKTEWESKNEDTYIGFGQKLFATNANDYSVLDIRDVFLQSG